MSKPIDTLNYKGYAIHVHQDDDPMNPRTDWDPLATMICWHRNYNLGDKHSYDDAEDFLWDIANMDARLGRGFDRYDFNWDGVKKKWGGRKEYLMEQAEKLNYILPLYLYDHSGITMNTRGFSCRWDSGQVGWIYLSKKRANEECPKKDGESDQDYEKRILLYLEGEVETYDHYLTGDVYRYKICNPDGDEIDSCSGYFGDYEPAKDEDSESGLYEAAVDIIDHDIKERLKARFDKLKGFIKHRVPFYVREKELIPSVVMC